MENALRIPFDRWFTTDEKHRGVDLAENIFLRKEYVKLLKDREIVNYKLVRVALRSMFVPPVNEGEQISFKDVKDEGLLLDKHYVVNMVFDDEDDIVTAQFVMAKDILA